VDGGEVVDVERVLPLVVRYGGRATHEHPGCAGAVDEQVKAPQVSGGLPDCPPGLGGHAQVGRDERGVLRRLRGCRPGDGGDGGAAVDQPLGDGSAHYA
jgi:hypothetical protein